MNKSQLRRLAKDYATGKLEHADYLRERSALIDAMVAGEIAIESSAESTADFAAPAPPQQRTRKIPLPLIVGACVVIGIVWAFFASRETLPPGAGQTNTPGRALEQPASGARMLVEEFLATRDWSGESLAQFRDHWNALTPNQRSEARAAPWFRRLAEALGEEINAHKALAEFDGSGLSTTTGKRLAGFGEYLGIDAEIPEPPAAHEPVPTALREEQALSGSQWLAAQDGEHFTLQLFAANQLNLIERVSASHPSVALHLLTFDGQLPRFRLVHGAFASEEQARLAHAALPTGLHGPGPNPTVRRIGDLREQLHNTRGQASMPIVNPPSVYTLQVFASSSSENVDRLVARYPALALRVHVSEGEATPYRVLYGSFDSTREAEDAAAELPAAMLKEVGKPLVRESADFP
jgi:hypothetical protein